MRWLAGWLAGWLLVGHFQSSSPCRFVLLAAIWSPTNHLALLCSWFPITSFRVPEIVTFWHAGLLQSGHIGIDFALLLRPCHLDTYNSQSAPVADFAFPPMLQSSKEKGKSSSFLFFLFFLSLSLSFSPAQGYVRSSVAYRGDKWPPPGFPEEFHRCHFCSDENRQGYDY